MKENRAETFQFETILKVWKKKNLKKIIKLMVKLENYDFEVKKCLSQTSEYWSIKIESNWGWNMKEIGKLLIKLEDK